MRQQLGLARYGSVALGVERTLNIASYIASIQFTLCCRFFRIPASICTVLFTDTCLPFFSQNKQNRKSHSTQIYEHLTVSGIFLFDINKYLVFRQIRRQYFTFLFRYSTSSEPIANKLFNFTGGNVVSCQFPINKSTGLKLW